jgi:hypothetical protein
MEIKITEASDCCSAPSCWDGERRPQENLTKLHPAYQTFVDTMTVDILLFVL